MLPNMEFLLPRNNAPPPVQSKLGMNPTLIVSWWCTIFSMVVILIRVLGRWVRLDGALFIEDKVMLGAIIPLLIRMALVHVVLIYGTLNTQTFGLTDEDIHNRMTGSRAVLASRIFYAIYIWTAKVTVLEFVRRLIATSWTKFYERGVKIIYTFLGLALGAVIVATLAECRPFSHYWQVVPDPGPSCRSGRAQLITMGTCDIITDVVLIIFPIPLVLMSKMQLAKKISLVSLFLLSLILIAITAYRIPSTISRSYSQQYRSLLASLEILAATCVANVIVIGSFLRDKGVKKVKYRANSFSTDGDMEGNVLTRPATRQTKPSIAQRHWGSDEDLVRDFGVGVSSDLRHASIAANAARMAPIAEPALTPYQDEISEPAATINPQGRGLLDPAWTFRKGSHHVPRVRRDSESSSESESSTDLKLQDLQPYKDEPQSPGAGPETPYRKMSFFDVGGLVDTVRSEQSSFEHSSRRLSTTHSAGPVSRSGQNFIADVGGLLGPSATTNDDRVSAASESSGYRSPNLLAPEHIIRERSRSPFGRVTVAEALRADRQHQPSAEPLPQTTEGPDSLSFSDAGGLLK